MTALPAPTRQAKRISARHRAGVGAEGAAGRLSGDLSNATGRKNMLLLIQLRWIAVIGQIVTIEFAFYGLGIQLPLRLMLAALGILLAFNVVSLLRWRTRRSFSHGELFVSLLVDVAMLTVQLYLSGGASNPFVFLYLLQVTLGAVLLKPSFVWSLFAITLTCFAGLALFAQPLALPPELPTVPNRNRASAVVDPPASRRLTDSAASCPFRAPC